MSFADLENVSVVIPCFNAGRWIRSTLESVSGQRSVLEIIAIDDGSTDDTANIIECEFGAVRLVQTQNQGASKARNLGTQLARGEFIQYLDADDLLAPGKVQQQLQALDRTGADVAYGDWQRLVCRDGLGFQLGEVVARQMLCAPELELFGDFWCPPAAYLFRRRIIEAVGGFNEGLPVIQDARFVLDCALHGGRFVYCPGVMAAYRLHGEGSLSRRDPLAFTLDVYRNACEVEQWWREHGGLSAARKQALIGCYGQAARSAYDQDRVMFEQAYASIMKLTDRYVPRGPAHLAMTSFLLGYRRAEAVARVYRRAKRALGGISGRHFKGASIMTRDPFGATSPVINVARVVGKIATWGAAGTRHDHKGLGGRYHTPDPNERSA